MEPLPARIAALADGLQAELTARDTVDTVLVDEAVAAMIRLELHLLLPAARDPNDDKWDIAHDRLFRRFFRAVDAVRYPKQRRRAPARTPDSMPQPPGGMAAALGGHAAQPHASTHRPALSQQLAHPVAQTNEPALADPPPTHATTRPVHPPATHAPAPCTLNPVLAKLAKKQARQRGKRRAAPPNTVHIGGRDRRLGHHPPDPDVIPVEITPSTADARASPTV